MGFRKRKKQPQVARARHAEQQKLRAERHAADEKAGRKDGPLPAGVVPEKKPKKKKPA
jgi:hypothetical protein